MKKLLLSLLSVFALFHHVFAQKELQAEMTVDLTSVPHTYNPMIFGQFIEHFHRQIYGGIFEPGSMLSDEQGFRTDVIEALRDLKVPVVRWPGGCFVSSYHWLEGVGDDRSPVYDKAWHVEDPNTFGTDEFIAWCRKIDAEPFICTNAGTGTPEEMSDWVEYCNLSIGKYGRMRIENGYPEPHNVKFWSIGNENYGAWELGAKTVEEWGYLVRESAKLMLSVDHNIELFAAALADDNWTIPLLERAGQYLSYVSIHGYWDFLVHDNTPSDYVTCMLKTTQPEEQIQHTIDILKKTGYDKQIKIAFDEWNLKNWHHPGHGMHLEGMDVEARDKNDINSLYTMADALFSACFLNSCLRNSEYVAMACMAPVVNTRGPLYVHPDGIVKRTTYHVMQLYANELQPNILPTSVKSGTLSKDDISVPVVDAVVTCNNDKTKYAVALVNKDPQKAIECQLGLGGINEIVTAMVLSGDTTEAYNDIENPERVKPEKTQLKLNNGKVVVPAHSLMILDIDL
ncbi:MAG TPA: alpha-L-arabinofuranosidase C-terminal domain-containing protein [Draconibacterium sp.]|nr:alpha-L-arabinofuranosidase C-terminal domain-containing protein [Draconibacterium sp.]